ncbi:MAG: hypothetical protein ACI4JW_10060 [Oscillospiraceae bacterium]
MKGCSETPTKGSKYCYLHDLSYRRFGDPDYKALFEEIEKKQEESSRNIRRSDSSSSSSSSSQTDTSSSRSYSNRSPIKKSSSSSYSANGYDDGYDDIYFDGEPDWNRYYKDYDYACGVDDAMEEYEEYGEDW